jgi:hypothetical protein
LQGQKLIWDFVMGIELLLNKNHRSKIARFFLWGWGFLQVFGGYHIVKGGVGGAGAGAPLLLNSNGLGGCNSMSSFPLASVSASLMSSMTRIVKAGSHLNLNVLGASLGSSIKIISLCSKRFLPLEEDYAQN